jgi:hypothetical protein
MRISRVPSLFKMKSKFTVEQVNAVTIIYLRQDIYQAVDSGISLEEAVEAAIQAFEELEQEPGPDWLQRWEVRKWARVFYARALEQKNDPATNWKELCKRVLAEDKLCRQVLAEQIGE